MFANAFINQPQQPTEAELIAALGPAKGVWDQLLSDLASEHGVKGYEWKCHSPKWGWSLRVKRKERTVVWLSPSEGRFTVLFILGDQAMQAARQTRFSQRVLKAMNDAQKWPEGTGIRLAVKSSRDIGALKKLAAIKIAN